MTAIQPLPRDPTADIYVTGLDHHTQLGRLEQQQNQQNQLPAAITPPLPKLNTFTSSSSSSLPPSPSKTIRASLRSEDAENVVPRLPASIDYDINGVIVDGPFTQEPECISPKQVSHGQLEQQPQQQQYLRYNTHHRHQPRTPQKNFETLNGQSIDTTFQPLSGASLNASPTMHRQLRNAERLLTSPVSKPNEFTNMGDHYEQQQQQQQQQYRSLVEEGAQSQPDSQGRMMTTMHETGSLGQQQQQEQSQQQQRPQIHQYQSNSSPTSPASSSTSQNMFPPRTDSRKRGNNPRGGQQQQQQPNDQREFPKRSDSQDQYQQQQHPPHPQQYPHPQHPQYRPPPHQQQQQQHGQFPHNQPHPYNHPPNHHHPAAHHHNNSPNYPYPHPPHPHGQQPHPAHPQFDNYQRPRGPHEQYQNYQRQNSRGPSPNREMMMQRGPRDGGMRMHGGDINLRQERRDYSPEAARRFQEGDPRQNGLPPRPNYPHPSQHPQAPRGLRVRQSPSGKQLPPRGMTTPDPSQQPRPHEPKPIIQMPLAFNSIAKDRQESTSPTSATPSGNPRPSTSLPDLQNSRPPSQTAVGRRPSAPRPHREHIRAVQEHGYPQVPQVPSLPSSSHSQRSRPPSPQLRSTSTTPPPQTPESAAEVRSSFRTALQNSLLHSHGQPGTARSSVATSNSNLTNSTSETGDTSVEDMIGMYESDGDDVDPSMNPIIDRQKRTGSGTPVGTKGYGDSAVKRRCSREEMGQWSSSSRPPSRPPTLEERISEDVEPRARPEPTLAIDIPAAQLQDELEEAQNTPRNPPMLEEEEDVKTVDPSINEDVPPVPPVKMADIDPTSIDTPPRNPTIMDNTAKFPRDRYGFKKQSQWVTLEEYDAWGNAYEETLQRRRKKWQALLKESGLALGDEGPVRFPPRSAKVKRFVRKGIPPEWRGAAWFWYAGGRTHLLKHPGLYQKLVAQGAPPNSEAAELIERDLHRTFPDNIHFKPESQMQGPPGSTRVSKHKQSGSKVIETPMVQKLRRVLLAFAIYVPRIGYCQSLNFWAGMLLLFMDEEKAFWMLYIITHQYLPGTHETSLEGSNIDQGVLMMSVRESVPHVWAKISTALDGSTITLTNTKLPDITLCTAGWLMSGFISNLPIETVLRVWDAFFYEGSKILFRISLALFKVSEPAIRAVNDPIDVFQIIQTAPRKFIDAGALLDLCFKRRNGYGHLSQQEIDDRRAERREIIEKEKKRRTGVDLGEDDMAIGRGSKDDLSLRKGFHFGDDAARKLRKYYPRRR